MRQGQDTFLEGTAAPVLRSGLTEARTDAEAFRRGLCVLLGDGQVSSHLCGCWPQLASAPASCPPRRWFLPDRAQHRARDAKQTFGAPSLPSPPHQPSHLGGPRICLSSVSPPRPLCLSWKAGSMGSSDCFTSLGGLRSAVPIVYCLKTATSRILLSFIVVHSKQPFQDQLSCHSAGAHPPLASPRWLFALHRSACRCRARGHHYKCSWEEEESPFPLGEGSRPNARC